MRLANGLGLAKSACGRVFAGLRPGLAAPLSISAVVRMVFYPFAVGALPSDMTEGAAVKVAVRIEAVREKGPVLQRLPGAVSPGGSVPRLETRRTAAMGNRRLSQR